MTCRFSDRQAPSARAVSRLQNPRSAAWRWDLRLSNGLRSSGLAPSMVSPQKTNSMSVGIGGNEKLVFPPLGGRDVIEVVDLDFERHCQVLIHALEHAFAGTILIILAFND